MRCPVDNAQVQSCSLSDRPLGGKLETELHGLGHHSTQRADLDRHVVHRAPLRMLTDGVDKVLGNSHFMHPDLAFRQALEWILRRGQGGPAGHDRKRWAMDHLVITLVADSRVLCARTYSLGRRGRSLSSLIPGFIAWPLTVCVAVFAVGRFLLFRDRIVDRLINRLYAWSAAAMLLYRFASMSGASGPVSALALALGCVVMATTYLYAIGCVHLSDIAPDTLRGRLRRCSLVALISTVAVLIAGARASSEGRPVDMSLAWDGIVIAIAVGAPAAINTAVFVRMVVREYRADDRTAAERVVGAGMILSMMFVWGTLLLSGLQLTTGWPQLGPHMPRAELAFTVGVVVNGIAPAFPLSMAFMRAVGLDREGRVCRRLDPLWRDLTAAVPEIVMHPAVDTGAPRDPATRVFRRAVEIRDALMHLAPYMPAGQRPLVESGGNPEDYAKRIAHAARARMTGIAPMYSTVASQSPIGGGDFHTDLEKLLDLAQAWRNLPTVLQARRA